MVLDQTTLANLVWLIPLLPLAAFFLIFLFTNQSRALSHTIGIVSVVASFLIAQLVFWTGVLGLGGANYAEHPLAGRVAWLSLGLDTSRWFQTGVLVDPLGAITLFFVSITVLCIFIYSVGYHNFGRPRDAHDAPGLPPAAGGVDPLYSRFFAFISLFAAGMFTLTVSDNLLFLFVGWEIMGLCSYLLIGFWYGKPSAYRAALKAFMTTRIGDVIMLLGIVYLYQVTGTLSFREIFTHDMLHGAVLTAGTGILGMTVAQVIFLLLFAGTVGKSAQWPLHVWLPDAMEGPTPVSAMIHAAAMVSAGVYMVVRMFPLLGGTGQGSAPFFWPMAAIGAFTALMASTMALAQSDIKRVLAFSTIAQLGYMIAALGVGAYVAAAFHLVTHAFFKALLFLGAGSVIHGVEHGHHHTAGAHGAHDAQAHAAPFDANDMFNMGGLLKRMPVTGWTFIIGGLALSGFPFLTAGFWSKDEIFTGAFERGLGGGAAGAMGWIVLAVLALSAFLTAFYTMRQIGLVFLGEPRTAAAEHAPESVRSMVAPLVVLAALAVTAGFAGIPDNFPGASQLGITNWFHHWLAAPVEEQGLFELNLEPHGGGAAPAEGGGHESAPRPAEGPLPAYNPIPLGLSLLVALGGLGAGWAVYVRKPLPAGQPDPLATMPLWDFFKNRWYWDELYQALFIGPVVWVSREIVPKVIDQRIIDGILHAFGPVWTWVAEGYRTFDRVVVNGFGDGIADATRGIGRSARPLQTGRVQDYILLAVVIAMGFIALFIGLSQ